MKKEFTSSFFSSLQDMIKRKLIIATAVFLTVLLLLFSFRKPIMRAFADFLIYENELRKVEAMFVLSGGAFDRGNEAVTIFQAGYVNRIICPGQNTPYSFRALGLNLTESELTKVYITQQGVPDSLVTVDKRGSSTLEEFEVVISYCHAHEIKSCIILSSKFHTRRIKQVFKKEMEENGIELIIRGAPSSVYNEYSFWESEYGLIDLNNEYIKQAYYFLKELS